MVADRLIQAVRFRHPTLAKNARTRVIAITPDDMYMEAMREQWTFTFSLRSGDRRFAVVLVTRGWIPPVSVSRAMTPCCVSGCER